MSCHTSGDQQLILESSNNPNTNFINLLATSYNTPFYSSRLPDLSAPLNVTSAFLLWETVLETVITLFKNAASPNAPIFYKNISSFNVEYRKSFNHCKLISIETNDYLGNNPANGTWTLLISILDIVGVEQNFAINVNSTGGYDLAVDLGANQTTLLNVFCNAILGTFQYGQEVVVSNINTTDDLLRLFIWMFVSQFWITLYDVGQIVPVNSLNGKSLPSTNNIFINDTLFQIHSSYLINNVIPAFSTYLPTNLTNFTNPPKFLPLNETNRLQPVDTSLFINYSCSERRIKGLFSVLISVFTADYAVIVSAYGAFMFIASAIQKRRDEGISHPSYFH
jgi:hypothetical protein